MARPALYKLSKAIVQQTQLVLKALNVKTHPRLLPKVFISYLLCRPVYSSSIASNYPSCRRQAFDAIASAGFGITRAKKILRGGQSQVSFKQAFSSTTIHRSKSRFSYKIAASYSGKGQKLSPAKNLFNFDPSSRFQPMQILRNESKGRRRLRASGQDSFFASRIGDTGSVAFGVADGVGGWADQGIDSADFSHGLCNHMADAAYEFSEHDEGGVLSAKDLLDRGFKRVCRDENVLGGGSTACIAVARPDGTVEVANLGDSGFIQMRLNAVHHYSNPQTHAFNTPYQLSRVPPKVLAQIAHFGGSVPFGDMPKDASVTSHQVRHGDVLIFATDGVWDNLTSQDTLSITSRTMTETGGWSNTDQGTNISKSFLELTRESNSENSKIHSIQAALALAITGDAKAASLNNKVDGPFAKAVQKQYPGEDYRGGKPDDICVVVALVCEST